MSEYKLLHHIHSPADLKKLDADRLEDLCREIRRILIATVSKNGGHLAPNLGVVELTVALHRVFETPKDKIVWDVGHQSYTHKLLTGRFDRFPTIRTEGGLSGYPKRRESEHDAFVAGHSSTSISVACGLARAKALKNEPGQVVAVIGDGAFTGGMVYEALNNAGHGNENLIVVLNDNEMSISPNVGQMARYLSEIRAKPGYLRAKLRVERFLDHLPVVGKRLKRAILRSKSALKDMLYHSNFFEEMGFVYFGPVDGHDIAALERVLQHAGRLHQPTLVHVETVKGKGYLFAEKNPSAFHGVSKFNIETGNPDVRGGACFSSAFGDALCSFAARDERICAVTAAMTEGTGLAKFARAFPDRFFDVGIAEQHAVTFSAGLAASGLLPVFAVYSSFLQRAYDQVLHDASIERAHVVLAVDRAGVVGEDGETHQGLFDVAFLSTIPGMTIYSPSNYAELAACLERALFEEDGPVAVRYPRGGQSLASYTPSFSHTDYEIVGDPDGPVVLAAYGRLFYEALGAMRLLAKRGVSVSVLKLKKALPIPPGALEFLASRQRVVFLEEGIKSGGIGEQIGCLLLERGFAGRYTLRAVDNRFVGQATVARSLESLGLTAKPIAEFVMRERES